MKRFVMTVLASAVLVAGCGKSDEEKRAEEVAKAAEKDNLQLATVAYGVGLWHLLNGRDARAREYFEKAASPPAQLSGFGSVAAYYELQRMKSTIR